MNIFRCKTKPCNKNSEDVINNINSNEDITINDIKSNINKDNTIKVICWKIKNDIIKIL